MALIHVIFPNFEAGCLKHSHSADSQDDFLFQPVPLVAPVQERSNVSILRSVAFDIGVEKENGDESSCQTLVIVEPSFYSHFFALNRYFDVGWQLIHEFGRCPLGWVFDLFSLFGDLLF